MRSRWVGVAVQGQEDRSLLVAWSNLDVLVVKYKQSAFACLRSAQGLHANTARGARLVCFSTGLAITALAGRSIWRFVHHRS